MRKDVTRPEGNSLLAALPADVYESVLKQAERVTLRAGAILSAPEQPIRDVYFPITAVLSVLSIMTDRSGIETAVIGYEGMTPLAAFNGVESAAEQVVTQVPGDALRLGRDEFDVILTRSPELRRMLHRFSQAVFTFAAQSSACTRRHTVEQRCARWLLHTHDRVPGDEFTLTHLFLSQMLGVRRSSVTIAAEALRTVGAISYSRGRIRIANRDALRERSCDCYDIIRSTYDRLLQGVATPSPLAELSFSEHATSLAHAGETTRTAAEPQELGDDLDAALEALELAQSELREHVDAIVSMRDAIGNGAQDESGRSRLDALTNAFVETDRDDRIVEANSAAQHLLGRGRSDLIGRPLLALMTDEAESVRDIMASLRDGGDNGGSKGAVLGGNFARSSMDVTITVARSATIKPHASLAVSRKHRGAFVGARWLLRRDGKPRSRA